MAGLYLDSRGYFEGGLERPCNTCPGSNGPILNLTILHLNPIPLSFATFGIGDQVAPVLFVLLVSVFSCRHDVGT